MGNDYSNGELIATILGIYLAIIVFSVVIGIGLYVLMSFALMSFFKKVGVEPWIAWVPIYNNWKWLEIGGHQGWFSLLALIPYGSIVTSIFLYIGMYRTGFAFRKDAGFLVLGIFLPFVWAFILGGRDEVYQPELITARGYPPPLAGYGSVPMDQRATNYPGPAAPAA